MSIFEKAARTKLRFETNRGMISAEQLFDMPLTSSDGFNLDAVALAIDDKREATTKTFVAVSNPQNKVEELRLDVVKRVIEVRQEEAVEAQLKLDRKDRRQKLLSALEAKEGEELTEMSKAKLLKELKTLDESED